MIDGLTILPFRANWSQPLTLRSMFVTDTTLESIPGSMRRSSGRDYGQREIRFYLLPDRDFRRTWDAFREANPPGTILGVPLWSDEGIQLTANAATGATTLHVTNTDFIDWRDEGVLWNLDDSTFEGLQIASASGNTITLAAPLSGTFDSGTQVLPLMRGYQLADYTENLLTTETSEIELTFAEDLSSISLPAISGLSSTLTYLGTPVLPLIAEWSQSPIANIDQGTHIVASGLNRQSLATLRQYVRQTIGHNVGLDGRQDRATLWKFFHDRRGRWDPFWLPSLKNELKLSADIGASDTSLQVENFAQFSQRFQLGADLRRAIFITNGDQFWCRQVSNLSGGTNRVTIDAPLGSAISNLQSQIGLLTLVQFATDDLEIECQTPLVATAKLSFAELEKEYVEVITTGTASGSISGMELVSA